MNKPPFEELFEQHGREIHAYLWRLTRHAADAEDCLQETFLRAFKAYGRLPHTDNLRAWLYKIATNTAHTHFRRNGHRAHSDLTEHAERTADNRPGTARQVESRLDLGDVHAAVLALPHKQRAALILSRYQGLAHREVAAALDISEDAARANLYQAVKKLKQQFPQEAQQYG